MSTSTPKSLPSPWPARSRTTSYQWPMSESGASSTVTSFLNNSTSLPSSSWTTSRPTPLVFSWSRIKTSFPSTATRWTSNWPSELWGQELDSGTLFYTRPPSGTESESIGWAHKVGILTSPISMMKLLSMSSSSRRTLTSPISLIFRLRGRFVGPQYPWCIDFLNKNSHKLKGLIRR